MPRPRRFHARIQDGQPVWPHGRPAELVLFDVGPRTRAFLAERGFELHRVEREGEYYCLKQPFQGIVQGDPPYAVVRQGEAFVDAGLTDAVREREERAGRIRRGRQLDLRAWQASLLPHCDAGTIPRQAHATATKERGPSGCPAS